MIRTLLAATALFASSFVPAAAGAQTPPSITYPVVLHAAGAAKFLPAAVFFHGQTAPVQARNAGGVQFAKDSMMLAALVDTSGYSSQVQQKYQAYLITETALEMDGHHLAAGAYGIGFIAEDKFIVMDIGGHDLFTVSSAKDADLKRPTPLQVLPDSADAHRFRLYEGRSYIGFTQAAP